MTDKVVAWAGGLMVIDRDGNVQLQRHSWLPLTLNSFPPRDKQIEFWGGKRAEHGQWYDRDGETGWLVGDCGYLLSDFELMKRAAHWRVVRGPE